MKNKILVSAFFLLSFSVSCNKDFLTEKPLAEIAPDNLYVNKSGFESGLYGIYSLWREERNKS